MLINRINLYINITKVILETHKISKLIEIKPALQKENAIWSISLAKGGAIVSLADGNVCKISY